MRKPEMRKPRSKTETLKEMITQIISTIAIMAMTVNQT